MGFQIENCYIRDPNDIGSLLISFFISEWHIYDN